ncbi:MAG: alpha-galactosidase [SAR202 cluster bacterium]|jgi:alpha-galactosidase|nr:alpha-galactosidase [SAR202 cluster bacterium]MDP6800558.1 alpha-galactosidase [SAR202 cluster bacterium]MQG57813.1 alpha-galactosidase [SAR202 cluster bacterium]MQG68136.1 alpha-galactosidase [SAR202 cluster bacterium]HAL46679.1 alpha-glucosidase/alpha-galactosidase [Dehalococcoidia bacterium]|tara:strand:- start:1054 stop:2334 length:1281 start_codon:yes stop_codon:yes gene_type:complete
MPKIAIIGAGSVVFTRRLLGDVLSFPSIRDSEISLMDIDAERLEMISALGERMAKDSGTGARIEATSDRERSLEGADYVITTIRVGDDDAVDRGIPQRYGVDQAVGDTIGPGGVIKALRTVPVLIDICRDMERLCPEAWLLNYTNPMAIACWAISDATSIQNVGLCHSVQNTARQLSEYIGANLSDVSFWTAGINHMAWYLRLENQGSDAYPALRAAMDDPQIFVKDPVRFEVMRHFGYFVSESTRHMSEYVPYFRGEPGRMERFGLAPFDVGARAQQRRVDSHYQAISDELASDTPMSPQRTNEYAAYIMDSMETGTPRRVNVNVRNSGLISNLPEGSCVEVPCMVDDLGVHPSHVGDLPDQCAGLIQSNINLHRLTVKSIMEGDREAAIHAAMLDPLTASILSLSEIRAMMGEMFDAQPEYFAS